MRHLSSTPPRTHATLPREVDVFSKGSNPELASGEMRRQTLPEKLSCDRSRLKKSRFKFTRRRRRRQLVNFPEPKLKATARRWRRCSQPIPVNALCTQEPPHPCPDCARMTWKKSSFGAIWELSSPLSLLTVVFVLFAETYGKLAGEACFLEILAIQFYAPLPNNHSSAPLSPRLAQPTLHCIAPRK